MAMLSSRRLLLTLVLCVLCTSYAGCGGRRRKRSQWPGPIKIPGLMDRVSISLAGLSRAYGRGDVPNLLSRIDKGYRLNHALLRRELVSELAGRRENTLTFHTDRIRECPDRVEVRCRWSKTYVILATAQRVIERGRCVMVFVRQRPMRLLDVRGDLPFGGG